MCSILKMSDYVSQNLKTGIHHLPNPQPIFFLKNSKELYHHLDQPSWTKSTTSFSNTDATCTTNTSFGKTSPQFTPPELAASSCSNLYYKTYHHISKTTDFLKRTHHGKNYPFRAPMRLSRHWAAMTSTLCVGEYRALANETMTFPTCMGEKRARSRQL